MTAVPLEAWKPVRPTVRAFGELFSTVVAFGSLAVVLVSDAGRDTAVMVWVLLACLPALVLTRPWRRVPAPTLWLLAALPTAAIAVSYLTPPQFAYARDLCVWPYAALLATVVLAQARTQSLRIALLLFVCVLGFYDFFQALVPWTYHGDPTKPMVGTFYQQDMFGAFCAATGLLAAAVAVLGQSPWRWLGILTAPISAVGCVLSTSRAAEALLLLGLITLGAVALTCPDRWRRLAAWALVVALSIGLLFLFTGPLLFPGHGGSPVKGTTQRSGQDSLSTSSEFRQAYWKAAAREFRDAPVVGEGFGAFGLTFFDRAPLGAYGSRYAHNGPLQGLGEGGLLFGIPMLTLVAGAAWASLRSLAQRSADFSDRAIRASAGFGALALIGHTLVDFDWTFPMLAGLLGLLGALAVKLDVEHLMRPARGLAPVAVLAIATLFSAYAVHQGLDSNLRIASAHALAADGRPGAAADALTHADHLLLPNPLPWGELLTLPLDASDPRSSALLDKAVRRTTRLGRLDPALEMKRASALIRLGRSAEGLSLAEHVVERASRGRPDLIGDYGRMLASAGQRERAEALVSAAIVQRARPDFPLPDNVWRLVESLQAIAGIDSPPAACGFAKAVAAFGEDARPLSVAVPSRSCPG